MLNFTVHQNPRSKIIVRFLLQNMQFCGSFIDT